MFKTLIILALVTAVTFTFVACGEKSTSEKLSEAAEAVKQDVVDAADDASDAITEAAEDTKDAARKATK